MIDQKNLKKLKLIMPRSSHVITDTALRPHIEYDIDIPFYSSPEEIDGEIIRDDFEPLLQGCTVLVSKLGLFLRIDKDKRSPLNFTSTPLRENPEEFHIEAPFGTAKQMLDSCINISSYLFPPNYNAEKLKDLKRTGLYWLDDERKYAVKKTLDGMIIVNDSLYLPLKVPSFHHQVGYTFDADIHSITDTYRPVYFATVPPESLDEVNPYLIRSGHFKKSIDRLSAMALDPENDNVGYLIKPLRWYKMFLDKFHLLYWANLARCDDEYLLYHAEILELHLEVLQASTKGKRNQDNLLSKCSDIIGLDSENPLVVSRIKLDSRLKDLWFSAVQSTSEYSKDGGMRFS